MKRLKIVLPAASILLCASSVFAQTEAPCNLLSKPDAESILGESVVQRANSTDNCWYVQNGFAGGTGPNNKQIRFSIYRSASPKADSLSVRRADIARDPTMAKTITKDVPGFADAAIWSWTPNWGRFNAFKGGIVEVEIIIAGIPEDAALQDAKKVASRALGGSGKSGFAYAGTGGGSAKTAAGGEQPVESPGSYSSGWMGQNKAIRGTVSRVEVNSSGFPRWVTIYFKESPDASFVVCSPYPDLFQERGGDLNRLVGATLAVTGQVESSMCAGEAASIRVLESKSYRIDGLRAQGAGSAATGSAGTGSESQRRASSVCKRASTLPDGGAPTEQQMCYAVEDFYDAIQRHIAGKTNAACNAFEAQRGKGRTPDYATALTCMVGGVSQSVGGTQVTLVQFRKKSCRKIPDGVYECVSVRTFKSWNPVAGGNNIVPPGEYTDRFGQKLGTDAWVFNP